MIKELIATLMISTGVAYSTPTFNNSETKPPLLENSATTDFSLSVPIGAQTSTTSQYLVNGTVLYTNYHYKTKWTGYNNALSCNATMTSETAIYGTSGNKFAMSTVAPDYNNEINYNNSYQFTNAMIAMQITPYNYLSQANANITVKLSMTIDITWWAGTTHENTFNMYICADLFTSTEENWVNYIDTSTYGTNCYNYEAISELTSSENGYLYNQTRDTITIQKTDGVQENTNVNIDKEIQIVSNTTNYVYLMLTPYMPTLSAERLRDCTTNTGNYQWLNTWEYMNGNDYHTIVIEGNMIIPPSNYEVIDIPGLCFEILTMPFVFISTAFNLTIFPGTPYQFNLANLFMAIIGVLVFIFILKIFVKNKFGA